MLLKVGMHMMQSVGVVLLFFCLMACSSDNSIPTTEVNSIDTTEYSQTAKTLSLHIDNVQEKHLEIMLMAYKELEAYYGGTLQAEVRTIRFVGKQSPWKPIQDGHYCIDQRAAESTEAEHIYYFANYCRSKSTLLRETNRVLYGYIDIQTCTELCACVMEKQLNMRLPKNMDCKTYCESSTWDLTCASDAELNTQCCQ